MFTASESWKGSLHLVWDKPCLGEVLLEVSGLLQGRDVPLTGGNGCTQHTGFSFTDINGSLLHFISSPGLVINKAWAMAGVGTGGLYSSGVDTK